MLFVQSIQDSEQQCNTLQSNSGCTAVQDRRKNGKCCNWHECQQWAGHSWSGGWERTSGPHKLPTPLSAPLLVKWIKWSPLPGGPCFYTSKRRQNLNFELRELVKWSSSDHIEHQLEGSASWRDNLDKYILQFGQIYLKILRQIHSAIWKNTFCNLDKYNRQFGQIHFVIQTIIS